VRDPIAPPAAREPAEALQLVSLAISDGDLDTAVAQYEARAVLRPWARGPATEPTTVAGQLGLLLDLRLPLSLHISSVLRTDGLALVLGERRMAGADPRRRPVLLHGAGATVLRRQPGGTWLIVTDAWCLAGPGEDGHRA
jgi:hypothetical protein